MLSRCYKQFTFCVRHYTCARLQYISDVHTDLVKSDAIPDINVHADNLLIVGDIGVPTHHNFETFLYNMKRKFKRVLFVPGNHDFDCGPLYMSDKIVKYNPLIINMCKDFGIEYLNNSICELDNNYIVAGSILWSKPIYDAKNLNAERVACHIAEHTRHVEWLQNVIQTYHTKHIIIATHFVPTFKLIESKYQDLGITRTSWFATDLEYMMQAPITHWLCGHTHSVLTTMVGNVYCSVNAHFQTQSVIGKTKFIELI